MKILNTWEQRAAQLFSWVACGIFFLWPWAALLTDGSKERCTPLIASAVQNVGVAPMIVIDAGHGGHNLGAHVQRPFCEEKRLTLMTARLVKKYLTQLGYRVMMTRSADAFVSLQKRVEIANQSHGDLFVSIHFNSSRNPLPQGIEVFFSGNDSDAARTDFSRNLARSILTRVTRKTQAPSRGIKKADFFVIRETRMPSVLVEGGFISNFQECSLLKNPQYIEKIARGIVEGIDHCYGAAIGYKHASSAGVEPATCRLGGDRSIH
jgi:N-acetylmuramoyl-L-alanine amidase